MECALPVSVCPSQRVGSIHPWSQIRRSTLFRPYVHYYQQRLGRKRTPLFAEKHGARQSYEDLARSYARSLQREEAQVMMQTPSAIQLMEILEGVCLLAAISLQLIPVLYAITQHKEGRTTKQTTNTATTQSSEPIVKRVVDKATEEHTSVSVSSFPERGTDDLSYLSVWSVLALIVGVVFGSIVRRFRHSQIQLHQRLIPATPPSSGVIEREEMENSIARAFSEISHLASQVEKLRIKVRLISREYSTAVENTTSESHYLKQAIQDVISQLKGTEDRIQDLNLIMAKMQGFASRQFEVVSSALRRIDKDCKALSLQLPSRDTEHETSVEDTATIATELEDIHVQ